MENVSAYFWLTQAAALLKHQRFFYAVTQVATSVTGAVCGGKFNCARSVSCGVAPVQVAPNQAVMKLS